jgi:hypothetical protein
MLSSHEMGNLANASPAISGQMCSKLNAHFRQHVQVSCKWKLHVDWLMAQVTQ